MPIRDADRRIADVLPAVVHQVPVGVGVIRRDRSIAYANDELVRILRLDPADPAGSRRLAPMRRIDGHPFAPDAEPLARVLGTGEAMLSSGAIATVGDGDSIELSVATTPIVDATGAVLGAALYAEDRSVDREDASLSEAFVGVLSHELRTPITAIYGGAQLLLEDRMPPEVRTSVLIDIAAEAEQLHRLVEDLLAIARVERGLTAMALEPVLLQRLAVDAARAEERRWPGSRVEVHAARGLPAVRADDIYTMQILRNLISNAVKYGPSSEPVLVEVTADEHEVMVVVRDRGAGFPPGLGSDAFQLFYRNPAIAARIPGTGIGLYVARALVEAQRGRIWLRERPGGGSDVAFALPIFAVEDPD